jgi:hypothetical protein
VNVVVRCNLASAALPVREKGELALHANNLGIREAGIEFHVMDRRARLNQPDLILRAAELIHQFSPGTSVHSVSPYELAIAQLRTTHVARATFVLRLRKFTQIGIRKSDFV